MLVQPCFLGAFRFLLDDDPVLIAGRFVGENPVGVPIPEGHCFPKEFEAENLCVVQFNMLLCEHALGNDQGNDSAEMFHRMVK